MLYIAALNSGSNGNSYYVGNETDAVLIDAGVSCRTIEKRMAGLELDIKRVRGIFISHEHTDHTKGVETLAKKYKLPIFISENTLRHSGLNIDKAIVHHFSHHSEIGLGGLTVHAFRKIHDAVDPFSFCVRHKGVQVGVFTDIGRCCENVSAWFKGCHAAFLESNYDENMLDTGPYPYFLKRRISGGSGHLSNSLALRLFTEHRANHLSHLILSHLSQKNNCPDIVEKLFRSACNNVHITVAPRHEATPLFCIKAMEDMTTKTPVYKQASFAF